MKRFQRALEIGSPGAGKSTFARRLRDRTGLPLIYLDNLWHLPDRTTVTRDAFDASLQQVLAGDAWIIDGNYSRTLPQRLARAEIVFLLDFPTELCLAGALSRIGTRREDLPWVETEPDPEFLEYIRTFQEEQMPVILDRLQRAPQVPLVRFTSREETEQWLQDLTWE